jgi:hypothetical protein
VIGAHYAGQRTVGTFTVTEPSHALTPRKSLSLCAAAGMQKQKTAKNVVFRGIILNSL